MAFARRTHTQGEGVGLVRLDRDEVIRDHFKLVLINGKELEAS